MGFKERLKEAILVFVFAIFGLFFWIFGFSEWNIIYIAVGLFFWILAAIIKERGL